MRKLWRTAAFVALVLTPTVMSGVTTFVPGESGVRGKDIIYAPAVSSIILCAAMCASVVGCRGFNWKLVPPVCELLYSLRTVAGDQEFQIYVPDIVRTSIELRFSCGSCMGSPPIGKSDWELDCPGGGVAVGVASVSSSLNDLDYLLCTQPPGLVLNLIDGAVIDNDRICSEVINGRPFPATALWSDQQHFDPPTSLRYQCREIISGQKLDLSRCVAPQGSQGAIPGVEGSGHRLLLCPPHMVAVSFYWNPSTRIVSLNCCLLYS